MKSFSTRYITALRFPLAVGVVMIHSYVSPWCEEVPAAWGVFHRLAALLSHILPSVSVPLFFAISGYLFFRGIEAFTSTVYLDKLRRRFFTLLVPYLAWNALAALLYWARDAFSAFQAGTQMLSLWTYMGQHGGLGIFWGNQVLGHAGSVNWAGWYVHDTLAPALMPLWFMRDLMCCALLSPLLYWLLRRVGWGVCLALGVAYISNLWPNYGGVRLLGLFYFSLGAWFSLRRLNPAEWAARCIRPAAGCALVLTLLLWLRSDSLGDAYTLLTVLYALSSMVCAVWAASVWTARHEPAEWLARGSFFLYASHAIVMRQLLLVIPHWCIPQGEAVSVAGYLTIPLLAVACCMAFYRVCSLCPGSWILTGHRPPHLPAK